MTSPTRREFLGGAFTLMSAASIRLPLWARAIPNFASSSPSGQILLGVDYYPDQTPETLWEEDSGMMSDMGFTNVRIAEFAWGLMEPSEGKFEFGWLHRAVEILHKHNIGVILGTPSAAPPPWLRSECAGTTVASRRPAFYLSHQPGLSQAVVGHRHSDGQEVHRQRWGDRLAD